RLVGAFARRKPRALERSDEAAALTAGEQPPLLGQPRGEGAADRHRLAVEQAPVAALALQGVRQGVPEVEQRARAAVLLVRLHHPRLERYGAAHQLDQL